MNTTRGLLVLKLNDAMYSKAAADDLINTLLLNGYTVTMKQVNTNLYVEYEAEITDEATTVFPIRKDF